MNTGLLSSRVWTPLRALRPFLWLLLVLVCAQWVVLAQLDRLQLFRTWLRDPSFSAYMLAELL